MKIYQLKTEHDKAHFRELSIEYFTWMFENLDAKYGITLDLNIVEYVDQYMESLENFVPPQGNLLLCDIDGQLAGMIGIKQMTEGICEIKRVYVRPDFRGKGIARQLIQHLIDFAKEGNYSTIRLETLQFMTAAQGLYHSFGFEKCDVYDDAEGPEELAQYLMYFELKLD